MKAPQTEPASRHSTPRHCSFQSIGLRYDRLVKVRDLIRKLESAGWVLRSTRGSHRQFKHPQKQSVVTVAGHPGQDVPIGTLRAILKAGDLEGV